jgi:Family of unknown function (DUF6190)
MDSDRRSEPEVREYLDHRVFLGLNAASEVVRRRCKALLVARMKSVLFMTFDQVGRCDDVIWRFSRRLQDGYYPFMDALHSHRCLQRDGYESSTLQAAAGDPRLQGLPAADRLLVARALERQAVVYTLDAGLLSRPDLPVRSPPASDVEVAFPGSLESLYQQSLELRFDDSGAGATPERDAGGDRCSAA